MSLATAPMPPDALPDSVVDTAERHRRWLRRACWIGCLLAVVSLIAVIGYPSFVRWQLERRGWSIEFHCGELSDRLPRFLEPWFSESTTATFSEAPLIADDVRLLSRVPRLWAMNVYGTTISEPTFVAISQLDQLQFLTIGTSQLDEEGLRHLARLPRLSSIELDGVVLNETGIEGISACLGLQVLRLNDVKVLDEDLAHLSKLPQLRSLSLYPSQVGDRSLQHLARITSLRTLSVSSKNITDAGVKHLGRLAMLKELDLTDCRVTDQGIREVTASCRSLRYLFLNCPMVTDAVLTDLAVLPSLESFGMYRVPISREQFREIKRFPSLIYLTLSYDKVEAIEPSDWDDLKRTNPKLEISFH